MEFQEESVTLHVSEFDSLGYWVGNKSEYVSAGTALGSEYTENVFVPSDETMTGKRDEATGEWTEIKDNRQRAFYDGTGAIFYLHAPDADFPEWAIFEAPPEFDESVSYVEHSGSQWVVTPFDKTSTSYVKSDLEKAREYLFATDFYVTRKLEKGTAIPKEVIAARDKCRALLVTNLPDVSFLG